jgi:hypothetical protein
MATNSLVFNPMAVTNAAGSFSIVSDGYVQGDAMDDPSVRNQLTQGLLASTETLPMIAGAMIYENISGGAGVSGVLGGTVGRALTLAAAAGFSVLNQAHHYLTSPQNTAPIALANMSVHFYRFGSRARIPLQIDPNLITSLQGLPIGSQVSWDYNLQRIVPFAPVTANENITSLVWSGGVVTGTTSSAHGYSVGNDITIAGAVPAGFNGDFPITSVPTTTTFTYALPVSPGTETTPGAIVAGGGLMPGKIIDLQAGNSKVYGLDPSGSGAYIWLPNGNTALVEI